MLKRKSRRGERKVVSGRVGRAAVGGLRGVTLIELLCVLAIIGVLVSLFLGPVGRAMEKSRRFRSEMEIPAHVERLTDGMRKFAAAHAAYQCPDLDALILFARPGGPTERWLRNAGTKFTPFQQDSPTDLVVIQVRYPTREGVAWMPLTKGELTARPE